MKTTRLLSIALMAAAYASAVTPPDKFFGFRMGADRKMARWDQLVDYYRLLEKEAGGKLKVVEMGPTSMGNPFLLVIITSPANMTRLERLRQVNARLSDPRGASEAELGGLVAEGKAVICQTMSLHASEIGGAQMAPELAFDLVSRTDEETRRILDNVVHLLVPSFNPDGQIMVTDFYRKYAGTEYEGADLPWLYHKYAGHDNNRDAFQQNLPESRYVAKIMFRDWVPQAYVDHHHQGSYGARIYVPPYAEPIRPGGDALVWREMSWYGAHIAYKEEEAGLSGVLNAASYSGWGHFGFHWITPFHNIAGMLTESASARLASPLFIHAHQLKGETRGLPAYEMQTTFPNPWPGGWWRLRDIVERQKVAAWAVLDLAARNRETVLWNAARKARRQTEAGAAGKPSAFVIPAAQHDPPTMRKMIDKLLAQGIEIHQTSRPFTTEAGMSYPAGSFVVLVGQPKAGVIRYLLGRTFYPDNEWTRARDGSPIRPYDMSTDTMFEFMGVRVDALDAPPRLDGMTRLTGNVSRPGQVDAGASAYVFEARLNDSFKAANLLFDRNIALRRNDGGDFLAAAPEALLKQVAAESGVDFRVARPQAAQSAREVRRMRIGMYQRYYGGNMDEGWTRLLLEDFRFPYKTLMDAEIRKGGLNAGFDVIILPEDSVSRITGEQPPDRGARPARDDEGIPPEYRSGIGKEGVEALKAFVENGGTLISFGGAGRFAIEKLGLRLRDVTAGKSTKEFWCQGSTLRLDYDLGHPLAKGMPAAGLAIYFNGNPVFEILPNERNDQYEVAARFAARDLLSSGWLIGEQTLAGKAAVVAVKHRKGRVILYGIRPQHRSQTHGTFKLLFNALIG